MPKVRFNHMELTFPRGTLTEEFRADVDSVFVDVFGWRAMDVDIVGQNGHLLLPDDGQFLLLVEGDKHMDSPGYDHLGLLCETRGEVDEIRAMCEKRATDDDRMRVKIYDDLKYPTGLVVHAFYFRWMLPIWFDVQVLEWPEGTGPEKRWQYTA
jgi:hypothetical protein